MSRLGEQPGAVAHELGEDSYLSVRPRAGSPLLCTTAGRSAMPGIPYANAYAATRRLVDSGGVEDAC